MAQHCTIIPTSRRLENIIFFHHGLEQLMLHNLKTSFIRGGLGISEVVNGKSSHLLIFKIGLTPMDIVFVINPLKILPQYLVGIRCASRDFRKRTDSGF
jgi:hypothetical protein